MLAVKAALVAGLRDNRMGDRAITKSWRPPQKRGTKLHRHDLPVIQGSGFIVHDHAKGNGPHGHELKLGPGGVYVETIIIEET